MDKRPYFLSRANEAAHPLFRETVYPKEELSALRMKEGDRLDLDFGDHFVGFVTLELGYEGDHPDAPLVILSEAMTTEPYAFAFAQGNDELVAKIDEILQGLLADGTIAKIFEEYDAPYTAP